MKMKKYFKAVCMALVFCFLVSYAMPVANVQAQTRSILKYPKTAMSVDGMFQVTVSLSVQDSVEQIIGYEIIDITPFSGVTSYEIIERGLENNNTRVYIHIQYYFHGTVQMDSVYIDM